MLKNPRARNSFEILDGFTKIGEMLLRVENIERIEAREGGSSNKEKSGAMDGDIKSADLASNLKPSKSSEKKSRLKSISIDKKKSSTLLSSGPSPSPPPPSSSASSPSIIRHYHPLTGATTATEGAAATRQHTHSRTQSAAFDLANDLLKGECCVLSLCLTSVYYHYNIHTYAHKRAHTHRHMYVHAHMYTYIHTYMHSHTDTLHAYTHTCKHTHVRTYIHATCPVTHSIITIHSTQNHNIHAHVHTHTNTVTPHVRHTHTPPTLLLHTQTHTYVHTHTYPHITLTHTYTTPTYRISQRVRVRRTYRGGKSCLQFRHSIRFVVPVSGRLRRESTSTYITYSVR